MRSCSNIHMTCLYNGCIKMLAAASILQLLPLEFAGHS